MPNNSSSNSSTNSSKEAILAKFSKKQLEDYCSFFDKSNLDELLIEEGGVKLILRKNKPITTTAIVPTGFAGAVAQQPVSASQEQQIDVAKEETQNQQKEETAKISKNKEVISPITGTFYHASSPDALPFVKIGDKVSKGQPLCIIEAMKIMNEIEAPFAGTISDILVENNELVKQNQVLFVIS